MGAIESKHSAQGEAARRPLVFQPQIVFFTCDSAQQLVEQHLPAGRVDLYALACSHRLISIGPQSPRTGPPEASATRDGTLMLTRCSREHVAAGKTGQNAARQTNSGATAQVQHSELRLRDEKVAERLTAWCPICHEPFGS